MRAAVYSNCTAATQWYQTDALGSVMAGTDSNGHAVAQFDYEPWGEPWTSGLLPGTAGDRQYNGRVTDPGTGFIDYGARLYWPEVGRFISIDMAAPEPAKPVTFNRYAYVLNNPYCGSQWAVGVVVQSGAAHHYHLW